MKDKITEKNNIEDTDRNIEKNIIKDKAIEKNNVEDTMIPHIRTGVKNNDCGFKNIKKSYPKSENADFYYSINSDSRIFTSWNICCK